MAHKHHLMQVYLAGPMRGIEEFNFPAFFDAAGKLAALDYYVHNPAREDELAGFLWSGTSGMEDMASVALWAVDVQPKSLRKVLAEDLEWILHFADAVVVLPGWEKSAGARTEVSAALAAGIPVATLADVLKDDSALVFDRITEVPPLTRPSLALSDEVRVTSETGGQKGQKLAQLGSLDPEALLEVAKVSGFGAQKYDRYNYLKGYDWSLSFDALERHLLAFWAGQDVDPESGLPHLGHAAWHCLALLSFSSRRLGTDDRFKQEDAS